MSTKATQTARQGGGYHRAARTVRPHVNSSSGGALLHARWRTRAATAAEKNAHMSRRFVAVSVCLRALRHVRPESRATRRYAARALGPRTQNTIIPSIVRALRLRFALWRLPF